MTISAQIIAGISVWYSHTKEKPGRIRMNPKWVGELTEEHAKTYGNYLDMCIKQKQLTFQVLTIVVDPYIEGIVITL